MAIRLRAMLLSAASGGGDPIWYLLTAPLAVSVTLFGLWLSQKGERRARAERDMRIHDAMFGYEGGPPGIYRVVSGDADRDSLDVVARDARTTANQIAEKQVAIEGDVEHIRDLSEAAAVMASDAKTASETNTSKLGDIEQKVDDAVPLAREAAIKASAAATATEEAIDLIGTHISEDLNVHEQQRTALAAIGAKVGAKIDIPPTKTKKAAPKKTVAKKRKT